MSQTLPAEIKKLVYEATSVHMFPIFEWHKYANMKLQGISDDHELLREALQQISAEMYTSAGKEDDFMSIELLSKLNDIDKRLTVSENELKHITSAVTEVKGGIKELNSKLDKVLEKFEKIPTSDFIKNEISTSTTPIKTDIASMKTEITHVKGELTNLVTNKKWLLTTIIAAIGAIGAVVKIIIG